MNHEIYNHIDNLNELVKTHAATFRTLQDNMVDDVITYAQYIEDSGRLSTWFLRAYDRLTAQDEIIIKENEDETFYDIDYEPSDYDESLHDLHD